MVIGNYNDLTTEIKKLEIETLDNLSFLKLKILFELINLILMILHYFAPNME